MSVLSINFTISNVSVSPPPGVSSVTNNASASISSAFSRLDLNSSRVPAVIGPFTSITKTFFASANCGIKNKNVKNKISFFIEDKEMLVLINLFNQNSSSSSNTCVLLGLIAVFFSSFFSDIWTAFVNPAIEPKAPLGTTIKFFSLAISVNVWSSLNLNAIGTFWYKDAASVIFLDASISPKAIITLDLLSRSASACLAIALIISSGRLASFIVTPLTFIPQGSVAVSKIFCTLLLSSSL